MAMESLIEGVIIWVMVAMLAAILYSMRYLVLLERKIARIDINLDKIARRILEEELKIEREEKRIEEEEHKIENLMGKRKKNR